MDGSRLFGCCRELAIEHGIPVRDYGAQGVTFVAECWDVTRSLAVARQLPAWGNKRHSLCGGSVLREKGDADRSKTHGATSADHEEDRGGIEGSGAAGAAPGLFFRRCRDGGVAGPVWYQESRF
jgi:hypothetical protein